ncbi:MAG: transglycosylase domain-containing protein [Bacteroidales bacterium]|nr:transglycosylase domain-containing protein [Bacteroidales bacterium]MCF8398238.1 transglycosylase domain-containing protein [Bacteroidales bacterium]
MDKTESKSRFKISLTTKFWLIFTLGLSMLVVFFIGVSNEWFGPMPTFEELENPESNLASEIYSADGKLLGTYYIENRSNIHYRELPPHLVNALLAIEDIRFENHSGVDMKALFRVAYGVLSGNDRGGGSTLTQQLAKNLFPRKRNPSTMYLVMTKFKEWVTAIKLERNYSKEEIIAMYLNTVDFGSQSHGIKAAAKTFYNKSPDSLNLQEAALLVGVVNAPTWYSPVRNPERAFNRRNLVLSQMQKYGFISDAVYDSVSRIPIDMSNFGVMSHTSGMATYLREYLRGELKDWSKNHFKADGSPYNIYKDGLRIYTTINSKMQQYAEEAVVEHLSQDLQPSFYEHWEGYTHAPFDFESDSIDKIVEHIMELSMKRTERYRLLRNAGKPMDTIKEIFDTPVEMTVFSWDGPIDTIMTPMDSIRYYKFFLQAGLMSMEPHTGFVRAYVGGIDYKHFQYDHVVQGQRQVGSTFKPFLYTLAMQEGEFTPCSKLPNVQPIIPLIEGDVWKPRNAATKKLGEEITLKYALATSNNWISGHLIKRYSPQSVIKVARKMGVESYIPPVYSIALGSADLTLYEMVGAFNTFANSGVYVEPTFITRIEDKHGNVIDRFIPEKQEAMSEQTAYLMLELLKGVVQYGTGIRLRYKYGFSNPIAGKTGTTNNQSDGWFMGIVPELSTGVWVGAEERSVHFRTIALGQGANMALPIWALYMKKVYEDESLGIGMGDFEKPIGGLLIETDCEKLEREQEVEEVKVDEFDF